MRPESERLWTRIGALAVLVGALLTYLLTIAPTVSYWDCPEYVTLAARLEPGHPPGNPLWMLAARVATLFAPDPEYVALAVNVTSALFTALAAMLLYLSLLLMLRRTVPGSDRAWIRLAGAVTGACAFMWSDTAWFSAVEAEVYAASIFFTALTFWVALRGAAAWRAGSRGEAVRYLLLEAYLLGLSIGVHELNLLIIPTLVFVALFALKERVRKGAILLWLLAGLALIGALLFALQPLIFKGAAATELLFTNGFGLPMHSGVVTFALLVPVVLIAAAFLVKRPALRVTLGAILLYYIGFCCYAVVYIRGAANPPLNTGAPGNIFALSDYLEREQYGSHPLLYGPTVESRKMLLEQPNPNDSLNPSYRIYYTERGDLHYAPAYPGAMPPTFGSLTKEDSAKYAAAGARYLPSRYTIKYRNTPELDMVLPRIFNPNPDDIAAYQAWTTMTPENMVEVEITEAVDSAGRNVQKLVNGERVKATAKRPTYWHNAQYLLGYQIGYMCLRYVGWNFIGRQNDVYSQGQADRGNLLTGIPPLDDLMLGPQGNLPPELGRDNAGRNLYFWLPFILGILGVWLMLASGKPGRRDFVVTFSLFVMTGIAIVVYLNQTPGEPRERDYSFVGAIYTFCFWIGYGVPALCRLLRRLPGRAPQIVAILVGFGTVAWMAVVNWDDHDRSGTYLARDYAFNTLESLPKDGIILAEGDNYIFPLWYAQEVEGKRRDVRLLCIPYLGTSWYPRQLLTPTSEGAPIPFTGRATDYDYGALKYVKIPASGTMDAIEALQAVYADVRAARAPKFPAANLRIAPFGGRQDSLVLNLRDISGGLSNLKQRDLIILDLVATNAAQGGARTIAWSATAADDKKLALLDYLVPVGPLQILAPGAAPDPLATYRLATTCYAYGIDTLRARYLTPVDRTLAVGMRQSLALTARDLAESGHTREARDLAILIERSFPARLIPYTTTTRSTLPVNSAVELAKVYAAASDTLAAKRLLRAEMARATAYRDYLYAYPKERRDVLSNLTRSTAQTWFLPYGTWLDLGFDPAELHVNNLLQEADKWRLDHTRRRLVAGARKAARGNLATDSATIALLDLYFALGGERKDLEKYHEFDRFPWNLYHNP